MVLSCALFMIEKQLNLTEKTYYLGLYMKAINSLLLEIWREVSRHPQTADAVQKILRAVAKRLSCNGLFILKPDPEKGGWRFLVAEELEPCGALVPMVACTLEDMTSWLRWAKVNQVVRGSGPQIAKTLGFLNLQSADIDHLIAPLLSDAGQPLALLVLTTCPGQKFLGDHEQLLAALLEPFAVLVENDQRLHEIQKSREAAEADNRSLLSRLDRQDISDSIVGVESGLNSVMERISLLGNSEAPVLIFGETGSGKEVVARAIHKQSRRTDGPFLRVNCGAIPHELIDSQLFGHERGSFSGAHSLNKGWFERADGGTLFLDEIGELPLAAQVRFLRVLQDGTFERVGGQKQIRVDVRIIAATHRNLKQMVADGDFREDLWYRIAVYPIVIPPLRDRRDDIPALAAHFSLRAARRLGVTEIIPTVEDNNLLVAYSWPGNVRELAAVIERAAILGGGRRLEVAKALGAAPIEKNFSATAPSQVERKGEGELVSLDQAVAQHIGAALRQARGRVDGYYGAARLLDINPNTLRAKMRKLKIDPRSFKPQE